MTLRLNKFEHVDTLDNGIERLERHVDTPMPEDEDGSGYKTEENLMTVYQVGDYAIKVSKISARGWAVRRYINEDGYWKIDRHLNSKLNAQDAKRLARKDAENLAQ